MDLFHSFVNSKPVSWLLGERRPRSRTLPTNSATTIGENDDAVEATKESKASQTLEEAPFRFIPVYDRQISLSLPNLFRATSIQDKSMKLMRQRRRLASYWRRNNKETSGETRELSKISNHSVSLDSLLDDSGNSSDSDDYCSCVEEANVSDVSVLKHTEKCKHMGHVDNNFVTRTSSIQEKSWKIRQKRKEYIHKRRSVDVSLLGHF